VQISSKLYKKKKKKKKKKEGEAAEEDIGTYINGKKNNPSMVLLWYVLLSMKNEHT
jgi:hypothetical protein